MPLAHDIIKTLSYYDVFAYPLSASEVFTFLPRNSITPEEVRGEVETLARTGTLHASNGYYSLRPDVGAQVERRQNMERYAARHWRIARFMTHIIKRCPYVRCVIVTGTLGKNLSAPDLDIDFFIITRPRRLWIARTLLILFKKVFLLNSRKYFCLNYFITEDDLEIEQKNIFTATEIAHTKSLYNSPLLNAFLSANAWIRQYFPNWSASRMPRIETNNRPSIISMAIGALLPEAFGDWLDRWLMNFWQRTWKRRYADLSEERREFLFQSTRTRSKAHEPDFQTRILRAYDERCALYLPSPDQA